MNRCTDKIASQEADLEILAIADRGPVTSMFRAVTNMCAPSEITKVPLIFLHHLSHDATRITNFGSRKEE
jgi:hypothetical protein